jgi:hypothetical protein
MSEERALVPIEQKQVEFYGDELTAVLLEDGTVYVPIRPICDYLGVDWSAQRQRVIRDLVLSEVAKGVVVITTPSKSGRGGGPQEMLCLPLDYLNGWMFGINAQRVKDEVRDTIVRYQRECYRVLADAFLSPATAVSPADASDQVLQQLYNMALVIAATTKEMMQARRLAQDSHRRLDLARDYLRGMNDRLKLVENRTAAGPLTPEQAEELRYLVNQIAELYTQREPGKKHYQSVYAALERETGVTSYKAIPPKGYEAARAFLDGWLKSLQGAE